jgi:hypothetical protein
MLMNVFSRLPSSVVQPAYNTVNKVLMSQKQTLKDYSHRNSIPSRLSPKKSPGTPCRDPLVSCIFQGLPKTPRGVPLKFSEIKIFQVILMVVSWGAPDYTH